jgi:hypothetical protein
MAAQILRRMTYCDSCGEVGTFRVPSRGWHTLRLGAPVGLTSRLGFLNVCSFAKPFRPFRSLALPNGRGAGSVAI